MGGLVGTPVSLRPGPGPPGAEQRKVDDHGDAYDDGGVGHIEYGPCAHVDEVRHLTQSDAVHQVPGSPTYLHAQGQAKGKACKEVLAEDQQQDSDAHNGTQHEE